MCDIKYTKYVSYNIKYKKFPLMYIIIYTYLRINYFHLYLRNEKKNIFKIHVKYSCAMEDLKSICKNQRN